jgi:hypothetical protein
MKFNRILALILTTILLAPTVALAQRKPVTTAATNANSLPAIKFTEYTLANGLRVILTESFAMEKSSEESRLRKMIRANLCEELLRCFAAHYNLSIVTQGSQSLALGLVLTAAPQLMAK